MTNTHRQHQSVTDTKRYTIPDLCQLTGLSRNSVYSGIRRGEIPCLKVGSRYILPRASIDRWLASAGTAASIAGDAHAIA